MQDGRKIREKQGRPDDTSPMNSPQRKIQQTANSKSEIVQAEDDRGMKPI